MIIKIKGSNIFTGSGLGNISSLGQPYSVTVTCSTSGATITITATGMTTVTSTSGSATMSNIPYGTVATYTVSASGYTTKTGTATSTRTIPVTLTAVSGGEVVDPEEPGTGGETPSIPDGTLNLYNVNDSDLIWGKTTQSGNSTGEFIVDNTKGTSGYIKCTAGDVIRGGTYRETTNTDGTNYYPYKSSPVYWYDVNKNFLSSTPSNPCFKESSSGSNDFILTVPSSPSGIEYFRVMISKQYPAQIITVNNVIDKNNYVAYPNPTTLEGTISEVSTSINMFNPNDSITTTTTTTTTNGPEEWTKQSDRGVSGFIQVKGGDIIRGGTYRETTNTDGTNYYPYKTSPIYLYDSQLNFMGRLNGFTETNSDGDFKATIPCGVKYIRTMINTKYINSQIITVNNTIDKTNFIAYAK